MGISFTVAMDTHFRSLKKFILHQYTGRSEIARICAGNDPNYEAQHNPAMSWSVAKSLKLSKQLENHCRAVFMLQPFSILPLKNAIIEVKGLLRDKSRLVIPNVTHCLQSLRMVNEIFQRLTASKNMAFNYDNVEHVELLESLWMHLKPNLLRSKQRHSKEWGELGFQGLDPATDFRGMGLLGLEQLVYFSKQYPNEAIYLLDLSNDATMAYFPFAATSINITALVFQLFVDHRLHQYIFDRDDTLRLADSTSSPEGASDDPHCVAQGVALIHDLFCELYIDFGRVWVAKKPKDLMDFPPIFAEFKAQLMERFPDL